jgi:hypothetical protein
MVGHVGDQEQRGMPAGDQQGHRGGGQRAVFQLVHRDVRGQVIDPVQRLAEPPCVRLGRGHPDQQGAGQPGSRGDGHGIDLIGPDAGGGERTVERGDHRLQVGPAGHLGYHAAEPGVLVHAGGDRVGEQVVAAHEPDPGLVTGGLDAQYQRKSHRASAFRMTTASTPDGW